MRYRYKTAEIEICVDIPFDICIQEESREFTEKCENAVEKADIYLTFRAVTELPQITEQGRWVGCQYYEKHGKKTRTFYCSEPHAAAYACICWNANGTVGECQYLKGKENYLNYSKNIWNVLELESLLLRQNGLLLHSSFIRYRGQAVLFSAPCGTGKSTQAELWERYKGADIINGDRSGLRCLSDSWTAYGLPYAGSSRIYRNESAPLRAIILLKQAEENSLRKIRPIEAFPDLYREITVHRWDRRFVERSTELLLQLLKKVPVYLLECRPDQEAVEIVRSEIFGSNAEGKEEL